MRILSILSIAISGFFIIPGSGKLAAQGKGGVSTYSTLDDATNFVFEPQIVPNVQIDRFQWGFDTGVRYDDNINLAPAGQEEEDFTYHFSPDFLLTFLGDQYTPNLVTLGYGADLVFGDGVIDDDIDVNQDVDLTYRYQSDRTRFALRGRYSRVGGVTGTDFGRFGDNLFFREIGRVRSDRFGITGDLDYRITNNLALDVRYGYSDTDYSAPTIIGVDNLNDFSTYGGQIGLNFGSDRFNIGPYFGYERIDTDDNARQEAFQYGGAITWEYSALTSFFAQLGYDDRSFDGIENEANDRGSFVWSAGFDWHPSSLLSSRLSVSRTILPSAVLDNQNLDQSSIDWALRRNFAEYYFGRIVASYAWVDYDSNQIGTTAIEEENFVSGYFELGRRLSDWGSASFYYRYIENESDSLAREYENNTVGFRLSVDF